MAPGASDRYDKFGSGLDALDARVEPLYREAQLEQSEAEARRRRVRTVAALVKAGLEEHLPSACGGASKRRRMRSVAERADAALKPDFQMTVMAPRGGKVAKIQKVGATVRKGVALAHIMISAAAASAQGAGGGQTQPQPQPQQIVVVSPCDGLVSELHVREGDTMEAQAAIMTVHGNALASYVSELRSIAHITCLFERPVPSVPVSGSSLASFVLAVGVQGVLTCRMAISRYNQGGDESAGGRGEGGAHKQGDEAEGGKAGEQVATPRVEADGVNNNTPRGKAFGDLMNTDDTGVDDGGDGGAGAGGQGSGKGKSGGFLIVDSISVSR